MKTHSIQQKNGTRATPSGARNDWHGGAISGKQTRGKNAIENSIAFAQIEERLDSAREKSRKQAARRYLKVMRRMVAQYNTHRHVLALSCGMGSCSILIDGECLDVNYYNRRGVYAMLETLEQALDWDWCAYLDNERLN